MCIRGTVAYRRQGRQRRVWPRFRRGTLDREPRETRQTRKDQPEQTGRTEVRFSVSDRILRQGKGIGVGRAVSRSPYPYPDRVRRPRAAWLPARFSPPFTFTPTAHVPI